jgi:DNA-binding NarL/FixJ family response regulator
MWAYKAIREYWAPGEAERWESAVMTEAQTLNIFAEALPRQEIKCIARSVARWTWRNTTPAGFQEYIDGTHNSKAQRARRAKKTQKQNAVREQGIEMIKQGKSNEEIVRALEVGLTTVKRWKRYFNTL